MEKVQVSVDVDKITMVSETMRRESHTTLLIRRRQGIGLVSLHFRPPCKGQQDDRKQPRACRLYNEMV
jgi:hypothetical protein